jgi:hypothetical protein
MQLEPASHWLTLSHTFCNIISSTPRHQWDSNQWHLNAWTQWAFPPVGDGEEHRTPMLIYIYCAHHVFQCLNIDFVWSTNTINISLIISIIYICIPVSGCVCRGHIALLWLEAYNAVIRRPWFELTTLVVIGSNCIARFKSNYHTIALRCHWFESHWWRGVLDIILQNVCDKVSQWLATGRWFSPVSSTIKTVGHDIIEILLKVALNTITLTLSP